jgi:helicase
LDEAYDVIHDAGLVKEQNNKISPTSYGKAVSVSFMDLKAAEYIKRSINLKNHDKKKKHVIDPLEIAVKLDPFENAYMSNRLNRRLGKALNANISARLFADSTLDILSSAETISKLDPNLQDALVNMQIEFMSCRCKDRPFCKCFQEELSRRILKQRMIKKDPVDISKKLLKNYQIHSYAGDIFSWLDSVIRTLEAIRRIANAFKNHKDAKECSRLIRTIEN